MISFKPDECRVLGVLVEKAMTTPGQYPLTVNSLVTGCSQKSNRHPVKQYDESQIYEVIESLKHKGIVIEAYLSGSRVTKFRHNARESLAVDTPQLVLLTELLLRGPQTMGELRGRASRMHRFESGDEVKQVLDTLIQRDPPYVQRIAPLPGSRAERFGQLLCPTSHPVEQESSPEVSVVVQPNTANESVLIQRIGQLESEVNRLRQELHQIRDSIVKMITESLDETIS